MDTELFALIIGLLVFMGIVFATWLFDIFYIQPEIQKDENRKELHPKLILDDFENERRNDDCF